MLGEVGFSQIHCDSHWVSCRRPLGVVYKNYERVLTIVLGELRT